ncbi:hypothetical protein LINPERHAP1_LOCUS8413 [Linum perenne]
MALTDYKWPREPGLEEEDGSSTPLENMPLVVGLRNLVDSGRSSSQTHIPSKLSPGVQLATAQSMQTPKSKVRHKMDEDSTAAATYNESMNALKRKSGDIGWQYGTLADPMNKDKVKCNFCDKVSMGVKTCYKAPPEAVQACQKTFKKTAKKKKEKLAHDQGLLDDVNITSGQRAPEEDITCVGSSTSHKLGPMDKWERSTDPKLSQATQLQQQRIDQALWQQRTLEVQQYIAKWVYTHAVSFNSIDNDEFKQMCEAIDRFGPRLKPPTQYDIQETLLKSEYARTKSMLKDRDEEKMKNESPHLGMHEIFH